MVLILIINLGFDNYEERISKNKYETEDQPTLQIVNVVNVVNDNNDEDIFDVQNAYL